MLWSQRLEDALPLDHPLRLFDPLRHGKRLRQSFRDVVRVGLRAELFKLEHVTTDGPFSVLPRRGHAHSLSE